MTTDKENYELWFEYVKRSDGYRKFCEEKDEYCRKHNLPLINQVFKGQNDSLEWMKRVPKDDLDTERPFFKLVLQWGNVHAMAFDEWYKIYNQKMAWTNDIFPPIRDLSSYRDFISGNIEIKDCIARCVDSFRAEHGREPTFEELGDSLAILLKDDPSRLYLSINVKSLATEKELSAQLVELIRDKKSTLKKWGLNLEVSESKKVFFMKPISKIMYEKIRLYLRVYDLHSEGFNIEEIIKKVGKPIEQDLYDDPDTQRVYYRYLKNAKDIIKNVERGIFPRMPD